MAHQGACLSGVTEGNEPAERQKVEHHAEDVTESLGEAQEGEQKVEGYTGVPGGQEFENQEVGHTEGHDSDDSDSKSESKDSEDDWSRNLEKSGGYRSYDC